MKLNEVSYLLSPIWGIKSLSPKVSVFKIEQVGIEQIKVRSSSFELELCDTRRGGSLLLCKNEKEIMLSYSITRNPVLLLFMVLPRNDKLICCLALCDQRMSTYPVWSSEEQISN